MGFAVIGAVLLAVCATVGSMLLARARSRDREFAIRVSLGADRARLIRQLLTESGILAALGGILGIAMASWSMELLNRTPSLWMGLEGVRLQPEPDVLLYTAAITILAAAASGLTPAWLASRKDLNAVMAGANTRGDGRRLSRFLVAAQVCLSVTLLICSALLVRSFAKAQGARTGFRWEGVTLARLDLSGRGFTATQSAEWVRGLADHLHQAVPGVEAAAMSERVMLVERLPRRGLRVEGYHYAPGESSENHAMFVSPGYLSLLGIPLLDGRDLAWSDTPDRVRVAVVNEAYARKYWPGKSALGQRMQSPRGPITIIGVAANTLFGSLTDPPGRPLLYLPVTQEVRPILTVHLKLRPGTSPSTVREALRTYENGLFPNPSGHVRKFFAGGGHAALVCDRVGGYVGFPRAVPGSFGIVWGAFLHSEPAPA
jgi:predicted permease